MMLCGCWWGGDCFCIEPKFDANVEFELMVGKGNAFLGDRTERCLFRGLFGSI